MKNQTLSLLLFISVFTACKKDAPPPPDINQLTNDLTASAWLLNRTGIDQNENGLLDISEESTVPCDKDDRILFNRDSTYVFYYGTDTCYAVPDSVTGQWQWLEGGTQIRIFANEYHVRVINNSRLLLENSSGPRFMQEFRR